MSFPSMAKLKKDREGKRRKLAREKGKGTCFQAKRAMMVEIRIGHQMALHLAADT